MIFLRRMLQAVYALAVIYGILFGLAVFGVRSGIVDRGGAEVIGLFLGTIFAIGAVGMAISGTLKEAKYQHLKIEGPPLVLGSYAGVLVNGHWNPNRSIDWSVALFGRERILLCRCESKTPGDDIWTSIGGQIALFHRTALRSVHVQDVRVDSETRRTEGISDALVNMTIGNVLGHKGKTVFMQALIHIDVKSDGVNPDRVYVFGIPDSMSDPGVLSGLVGDLGGEALSDLPGAAGTAADVGGVGLEIHESMSQEGTDGLDVAGRIAASFVTRATGQVPERAAG